MLYEVLGDIWVVQRKPYLRRRPAGQPEAPRLLVDALHHRLVERSKTPRRHDPETRCATRRVAGHGAARGAEAFDQSHFDEVALRQPQACWPLTRQATTSFDGLSRVSPTSPTPPTGASNTLRRADAGHRGRDGRAGAELHRAGLTIIPRGGGTGYTGSAVPLTWKRRSSTPKSSNRARSRWSRCPASTALATIRTGAGVVTQRVADAAERGLVFAVDPTSAEA